MRYEEEIRANRERAYESLKAARCLSDAGLYDDAASRAYYAAFHAATAVMQARGRSFRKHGALIGAIHKHLVHEGILDKHFADALAWLFELRATGDYGDVIRVSREDAGQAINDAEQVVETLFQLVPD